MHELEMRKINLVLTIATACSALVGVLSFFMPFFEFFISVNYIEAAEEVSEYLPILISLISFVCAVIAIKVGRKMEYVTASASAFSLIWVLVLMNEVSEYLSLSASDYASYGYTVFLIFHVLTIILAILVALLPTILKNGGIDVVRSGGTGVVKTEKRICPKCWAAVGEDAVFCPSCGTRMSVVSEEKKYTDDTKHKKSSDSIGLSRPGDSDLD